jgi:hypothetical protein
VCWHPAAASQESVVHGSPSSQLSGVWTQPVDGLQLSSEQTLRSSQLIGVPVQPVTVSQFCEMHWLPWAQSTGVSVQGGLPPGPVHFAVEQTPALLQMFVVAGHWPVISLQEPGRHRSPWHWSGVVCVQP